MATNFVNDMSDCQGGCDVIAQLIITHHKMKFNIHFDTDLLSCHICPTRPEISYLLFQQ